jgi:hypothetical protein
MGASGEMSVTSGMRTLLPKAQPVQRCKALKAYRAAVSGVGGRSKSSV